MSFDLNFLFENQTVEKHIEPDRIFASLIKNPEYEYLRGVQTEILDEWFLRRNDDRDIILKMNTGAGKTLVGLLMLQSSINEGYGPAIYLCPDRQLVGQVLKKSAEYGIKCVTFTEDQVFPPEFLNSEAILVAVFDKVFNGQSVFEKHDIEVGTVLLDDAHSCISKTREKFTIKLSRNSSEYSCLFRLFENDLKEQDLATFTDIELEHDLNSVMLVPHWTWINNISAIATILSEGYQKGKGSNFKDLKSLYFTWPLLKKYIESCYCFLSAEYIEITPFCIPIKEIRSFHVAKRRIFMSATLLDDSLLIKELDVSRKAVLEPLKNKMYYNIGERMILLPGLLHNSLNYDTIPELCKRLSDEGNNVVILTSTFYSKVIERWRNFGAEIAYSDDIIKKVEQLDKTSNNMLVLANRYDGIDLKGNQCRVLVMDGLPAGINHYDQYLNEVRPSSRIMRSIQAQRIEQGIGRSTRTSSDYSVVIILGNDLITFMSMNDNKKYLSPQTKMQVEIGLLFSKKVADNIHEDNAIEALYTIIKASLDRNVNWIKYHNNQLQKAAEENLSFLPLELTEAERKAYELFYSNRALEAAEHLSKVVSENFDKLHKDDIGWYYQIVSAYMYKADRGTSMEIQMKAHENNTLLCKVPEGVKYKKLDKVLGIQPNRVFIYANNFSEPNALVLHIAEIISKLNFGVKADYFESSLYKIAEFLGFEAQRPEKEFKKVSDVLWHMTNNEYLIFEAKNFVKEERQLIYKSEAEQITNSINWFRDEDYIGDTGYPIIIHPSTVCAPDAFPDPTVRVMDKEKLDLFIKNINGLTTEIANKLTSGLSVEITAELINKYYLTPEKIKSTYFKPFSRI